MNPYRELGKRDDYEPPRVGDLVRIVGSRPHGDVMEFTNDFKVRIFFDFTSRWFEVHEVIVIKRHEDRGERMSDELRKLLEDIAALSPMLDLKKEIADRFKPLYIYLIEQAAEEAERHAIAQDKAAGTES